MKATREALLQLCLSMSLSCVSTAVYAQAFPAKPLRLVVSTAPGGGDDLHARVVAEKASEVLGQQVIVDNRSGAGGLIGQEFVARAAPDGYTLMFTPGSLAMVPSLRKNPPFDVLRDFSAVGSVCSIDLVLVVHPSVPAKSVQDLVALARQNPGKLNYGSAGLGVTPFLAAELLKSMAKIDIVQVSYKGGSLVYLDLLKGDIDMYFGVMASALPHIKNGKVKALGVSAARRTVLLPDVPTIAESGLPGYELTTWYAVLGPRGMPSEVVARLNAALAKVVAHPDFRERLLGFGSNPETKTPTEIAERLKADVVKFGEIARFSGIKPE